LSSGAGRNIERFDIAIEFNEPTCRWQDLGDPKLLNMGDAKRRIIECLRDANTALSMGAMASWSALLITEKRDWDVWFQPRVISAQLSHARISAPSSTESPGTNPAADAIDLRGGFTHRAQDSDGVSLAR
jgi:hypothetical protein